MLALANLRARWSSVLATFLAVAAGVALTGATLLIASSARPPVQPRLAGTAALVVATQDPDQRSAPDTAVPWTADAADRTRDRLAAVPGVAGAVVDRSFYAQAFPGGRPVGDPDDDEAGHGWSSAMLAPLTLTAGTSPAGPDDVVVDRALGVPVGAALPLATSDGVREHRVTGTVDGPGFYVTDAAARTRSPGAGTIGILAAPGAEPDPAALASAAGGGGSVLTGDERAVVEPGYLAHQRFLGTQVIAAMALLVLFTTVFVVSSTMSLTIAARRRELGLLRLVGATPRQLRRMILGEALGIGSAGGVVGAVAGVGLAPVLRDVLIALRAAPPGLGLRVELVPLLTAIGIGVAVTVTGAAVASRTASRVRPLEALQEASVEQRGATWGRGIAGLAALGAGAALAAMSAVADAEGRMGAALGAAPCFIAAAALLAPRILGPVVRFVTAPVADRSGSAVPGLVRAELLAASGRAAATAAPVIAAVGFAVVISGMVQTMAAAYPASQTRQLAGQVVVQKQDTPGLSEKVLQQVGTPPGSRAPLPATVHVVGGDGRSVGVDAVGQIDRRLVAPDEVVLSEPMASTLQTGAGRTLSVSFADGTTEAMRVTVRPVDPARGDFVLARATVRAHDPDALASSIFLPSDRAPASSPPGATVQDARSYALADYEVDARLSRGLATLLVVITVAYSGLAIANGLAMSAHGRRADFRLLASAGATRRQLLAIAAAETSLVAVVGVALGVLVTFPPLLGMASGLSEATATEVGLRLDGGTLAAVSAGCLLLAVAASVAVTAGTVLRDRRGQASSGSGRPR